MCTEVPNSSVSLLVRSSTWATAAIEAMAEGVEQVAALPDPVGELSERKRQRSGIEVAPFTMPLARTIYRFPALSTTSFKGLPGLLADSLPDDFGNALISAWLARQGRSAASFTPIERLCYTGSRGMGALEYLPAFGGVEAPSETLDLQALVQLASDILRQRQQLELQFEPPESNNSLNDILRIRYRIDGELQEIPLPAQLKQFQPAIVSRVKILSHLNL